MVNVTRSAIKKHSERTKANDVNLKKVRKRIETVFSQLCDQFMMQRNYAKSFAGFEYRVLAKVTTLTVLHLLNKSIYNKYVGRVKHILAN